MKVKRNKSIILNEINKLKHELREIERQERNSDDSKQLSERQVANIQEYERRLAAGEELEPLREVVDLEALVGSEVYESVLESEKRNEVHAAEVRGKSINFYTPNRRALWQSFGQEHIEPELLNFIDNVPQDGVYFDVGASTGIFAIYAAIQGKRTYCFEPEASNFHVLNTNAFLNFPKIKGNFKALNIALSDKTEISSMYIRKFEAAAHEKILGKSQARDGVEKFTAEYEQSVLTMTMDEFCSLTAVSPTDIKIDVDGAELKLVLGMHETLTSPSLKRIFIEVSEVEQHSTEALGKIMSYGFEISHKTRVQNYFTEYNYTLVRT